MPRSLWKGALSFGLVSIPVEIHTAVRDLGPHFHLLRRSDKSRISYRKVATKDEKDVSREQLVKGYEYAKGRYIVLQQSDFDSAAVERHRRIDLLDFVEGDQVDDRYFNKPYYLLPGPGGERAYCVLRAAIRESGRVGIAKFVMRNKPHLAAVEAIKDALVLSTMRFREELVAIDGIDLPNEPVQKSELKLAHQLIDALAADWDPDKYTDEYRANLLRIIEARVEDEEPELERQEPSGGAKVLDLMERLRQSLDETTQSRRSRERTRRAKTQAKKTSARKSTRKKTTRARGAKRRAA